MTRTLDTTAASDVEPRARLSEGRTDEAIHRAVARALKRRGATGCIADIGCGTGGLWPHVRSQFDRCVGVDVVAYDGLPSEIGFRQADLDRDPLPIADGSVDAAVAVEVIEHLENPRRFVRELARITRPGGWMVVTTPNQLSFLSLLTLVCKRQFSSFQDADYPAHRTALLEIDLRRIAEECGLRSVTIEYTLWGRIPLTARHYARPIAALAPRYCSGNVLLVAER